MTAIDKQAFKEITGLDYRSDSTVLVKALLDTFLRRQEAPYAVAQHEARLRMQGAEILGINAAADGIEELLEEKEFSLPSVYSIFTAGFDVPENSVLIGKYGEKNTPFESFPPTDIHGHAGQVYIAPVGEKQDETMLILKGRAHPYEWSKDPYGDMVVAHPFQVFKELARRQRASLGVDPTFIFTYLTGVQEGSKMKPGDLGIILDDSPADNDTHPGHGPRALLDEYVGGRFQPKAGRASNKDLARYFSDHVSKTVKPYPVAAVGTPGTTEFQSDMEAQIFKEAFKKAVEEGNFSTSARSISGRRSKKAALLYCMGVTAELAAMRQTFLKEQDFRVLALGLATDAVGGKESETIDHNQVVEKALQVAGRHRDSIMSFVNTNAFIELSEPNAAFPNHSIEAKIGGARVMSELN